MSTDAQRLLDAAEHAAQRLRRGERAGSAAADALGLVSHDLLRVIREQAGGHDGLVRSVLSRPGDHSPEQIRQAARSACDQLARALDRPPSRSGLALYEVIMAVAFIERSTLGTPAASHVRGLSAAADVTSVLARWRQLSTGTPAEPVTTADGAAGPPTVPQSVASLLAADARRGAGAPAGGVRRPGWDADQAVTVLYGTDCRALTRLATLLVSDAAIAEEIVQDAFVAMHGAWRQLRDRDKALCFLRQAVLSRARSDRAAHSGPPSRPPEVPGDGHQAGTKPERQLVAALRDLPARQREALVLRYYADLPEIQVARVMGISARAVGNHIARGMSSLQGVLEGAAGTSQPGGDAGPP